jgi:hypothetical protein
MRRKYPVGTRFRIYAKLTDKEGGNPLLHTHHNWDYEVLDETSGLPCHQKLIP